MPTMLERIDNDATMPGSSTAGSLPKDSAPGDSRSRSHHSTSNHARSKSSSSNASSNAAVHPSQNSLSNISTASTSAHSHHSPQSRHGMTVDPRFSSNTTPRSPGASLTEQALRRYQIEITRFGHDPGAASSGHRGEEHASAAARGVGLNIGAAATKTLKGMTPLERFEAEKKHRQQPWSSVAGRR